MTSFFISLKILGKDHLNWYFSMILTYENLRKMLGTDVSDTWFNLLRGVQCKSLLVDTFFSGIYEAV